VILMK